MRRLFILAVVIVFAAALPAALTYYQQGPVAATAALRPMGSAMAVTALQASLDAAVARTGWADDEWSVLAVSLDRGDTLYSHTPDRALAPASTLKLMTTAAALHYLGPEYRYHTYLLTNGRITNGVLEGNVYLYGTGDPTLGIRFAAVPAPPLQAFADTLRALGVREIRGDVVGDGSYFEGSSSGRGWEGDYLNAWYAAPAGALSVHENLVRLDISPAERPGWRPTVKPVPGGEGIAIVNTAVTGGGNDVLAYRLTYDGPVVLEGRIGAGTLSRAVNVADPARYAAALFRDVVLSKGITHSGAVRAIQDPERSLVSGRKAFAPDAEKHRTPRVLAVHTSQPLREILTVINHRSHNFYAEQVVRTIGRVALADGSIEGGTRAVKMLLAKAGADTAAIDLYDGCGLSPLNRVNARTFIALLDYMAGSSMAQEFEQTLAVAGRVARFRRMGGTPAEGNLRAKTGTIDHVSALAGYVNAQNGERIAFAIVSNNVPSVAQAKYIENVIGASLASFSRTGSARPVSAVDGAHTGSAGAPDAAEGPRQPRRGRPATSG